MADKKGESRGQAKGKTARAPAKSSRRAPIVSSSAPPAADEATAAPAPEAAPQSAQAQQQQTTISTSRGFVDFLATNHLSLALTSYQTGQLMLIGPLLDVKILGR